MFCTKCGKNNPDFGKFCYGCGSKLPESAKPVPPPVPAPRPVLVPPIPIQKTVPKPPVPPPPKKAWSPLDPITTLEAAQKSARRGSVACFIIAAITTVFAALVSAGVTSLPAELQQAHPQPMFLEGALVAYAGWQVRKRLSRGWALTALGLYSAEIFMKLLSPNKGAAVVSIVFAFFLVEGVRGTFTYHRLMTQAYQAVADQSVSPDAPSENLDEETGGALDWLVGKIAMPPGAPQLMPRTSGEARRRRLLAVAAGLGCGFCMLAVLGTIQILETHKAMGFLVAAVVMLLATMTFVEPLVQSVSKAFGLENSHGVALEENKKNVQMALLAVSFVLVVLHNLIHETIDKDLLGSLLLLTVAIVVPGRITLAWVDGLRQKPVRAMFKGGQQAFVTGALVILCFWAATGGALPLPATTTPAPVTQSASYETAQPQYAADEVAGQLQMQSAPWDIALRFAALNGVQWGLLGLAAGFAIEKQWGKRRALGVMVALTGMSFVIGILMNSAFNAPMEAFIITLAQGAGWGIGLLLYPPAERAFRLPEPALAEVAAAPVLVAAVTQDVPAENAPEETA